MLTPVKREKLKGKSFLVHSSWFIAIFFLLLTPYFLIHPGAYAYSETTYYIHQDNLGSVVAVTSDATSSAQMQKAYNSYGSLAMKQLNNGTIEQLNNNATEREYTGQIKDSATNLQYYNARYYDPILSRFTSPDQMGGGNRYSYVGNNPISNSDPTGNMVTTDDRGGGGNTKKPPPSFPSFNTPISSSQYYNGTLGDLNASSVAPDWLNNPTPATEEERRQAIDELIGSGTGFGSNFFNKLINKWLFQRGDRYENKMFRMEWNGANDRDKIDMISSVIHDNIPYALEYGIKTKKENGYGYYYDFWKLVDRERSADYGERYQAFVIDNNFGTISSLISPVRRYLDKMFVCTDFADLLKVQVNRLVPSVDFNLLESYSGDHKYNSYIMNGQQYIVDPTWNISTTSLITDMKNRPLMYKNYEFDSKGDFVSSISRGAVGGMMRSLLAPLYTVISPRRVTAEEFLNQQ